MGNDPAPILGVLFESIALKRIDLVADDAHNCHWQSFRLLTCGRVFTKGESGHRGDHAANGFSAVYVVGGRRRWPHFGQYGGCRARTLRLTSNYEC